MEWKIDHLTNEMDSLKKLFKELQAKSISINHQIELLQKNNLELKTENKLLAREIEMMLVDRKNDQMAIREFQNKEKLYHFKKEELKQKRLKLNIENEFLNDEIKYLKTERKHKKISSIFKVEQKSIESMERDKTVKHTVNEEINTFPTRETNIETNIETKMEMKEVCSQVYWKIENFYEKYIKAKKPTVTETYSEPFYSHKNGYKLCLVVYLGGMWRGNCLYFGYFLMSSKNDDNLSWPFEYDLKFDLINQTDETVYTSKTIKFDATKNCGKWDKPTSERNDFIGMYSLINISELLNNYDLYQNDEILVRATLERL